MNKIDDFAIFSMAANQTELVWSNLFQNRAINNTHQYDIISWEASEIEFLLA